MTNKEIWTNYINWLADNGKIEHQGPLIDLVTETWNLDAFLAASGIDGINNDENAKEYLGYLLERVQDDDGNESKYNLLYAASTVISEEFQPSAGYEYIDYHEDYEDYNAAHKNYVDGTLRLGIYNLKCILSGIECKNRVTGDVDYIGLLKNFDEAPVSELMKLPYVFYNKQGEYGTVLHEAVERLSLRQLERFLSYIPDEIALNYINLIDDNGYDALDILRQKKLMNTNNPKASDVYRQKIALLNSYESYLSNRKQRIKDRVNDLQDMDYNPNDENDLDYDDFRYDSNTQSTHTRSIHATVDDALVRAYLHLIKGYSIDDINAGRIEGVRIETVSIYNDSIDNPQLENRHLYGEIRNVEFNEENQLLNELHQKLMDLHYNNPENEEVFAALEFFNRVMSGRIGPKHAISSEYALGIGLTIKQVLALCYKAIQNQDLELDSVLIKRMADSQCGYALDINETDFNILKNRCAGGTVNTLTMSLVSVLDELVKIVVVNPQTMRSQFGAVINNGIESYVSSIIKDQKITAEGLKLLIALQNKQDKMLSKEISFYIRNVLLQKEYDELEKGYLSFKDSDDIIKAFSDALRIYELSEKTLNDIDELLDNDNIILVNQSVVTEETYDANLKYGYTYNITEKSEIASMTDQEIFSYVRTDDNQLVRLYEHKNFSAEDILYNIQGGNMNKLITLCKYSVHEFIPMLDIEDEQLKKGGKRFWRNVKSAEVLDAILHDNNSGAILNAKNGKGRSYTSFENILRYSNSLQAIKCAIELGADVNKPDFNGISPLHWATQMGRTDIVKLLIENGADIEFENKIKRYKKRPLQLALEKNDTEIISFLIKNGADVNVVEDQSFKRMFVLHWALDKGYKDIARLAIENDADLSKECCGKIPLQLALEKGYKGIARLIIEKSDIDLMSQEQCTESLKSAIIGVYRQKTESDKIEYKEIIKSLIENGSKLDVVINSGKYKGYAPLHWAIENGYVDIVDLLIAKGANIDKKPAGTFGIYKTPMSKAIQRNVEIEKLIEGEEDHQSRNMHLSDLNKNLEIMKLLIENGAKLNKSDFYDNDPLHYAVIKGYTRVVEALIERKAIKSIEKNIEKKIKYYHLGEKANGYTPIEWAIEQGYEDIAKLLMENVKSLEQSTLRKALEENCKSVVKIFIEKDKYIDSRVLNWAVEKGHKDIIELLIEKGKDIASMSKARNNLLFSALESGNIEIVELLLNNGYDPNAVIRSGKYMGYNILQWAIENGRINVVDLLIKKDVDVNKVSTISRETPMSLAVKGNKVDIIKLLIANGSDLKNKDFNGESPLHWAIKNDHIDVVDLLIQRDIDINEMSKREGRTPYVFGSRIW